MRPSSCPQALPDQSLELYPYGLQRHLADDLRGKRIPQQSFGLSSRHATTLCVEERGLVQAADGGTMRTLHVIRKDLELRLRVDSGGVTQQEIPIGLLCVGLLRFRTNEDLAVKHRARVVVQDALINLPAATVRLIVVNGGVIVDQLPSTSEIEAVEQCLDVLVIQPGLEVVPGQRAAHRQRKRAVVTVSRLSHECPTYMIGPLTLALDPGVLHPGARTRDDFDNRIGPVPANGSDGDVTLDNRDACTTAHEDEAPGVDGAVLSFLSCKKDEMNGILEVGARWDLNQTTVTETSSIQGREGIGLDWSKLTKVAAVDCSITQRVGEAANPEPFGHAADRTEFRLIE